MECKIRLFHDSNSINCLLNVLLRMNRLINQLPSFQEPIINRILLDLFIQLDTNQEEIDINPFIQYFKLNQNNEITLESLFPIVMSEIKKSNIPQNLLNTYLINQKKSSSETPIDELILKSNISIQSTKYFFIQFENRLHFDLSLTLELSESQSYDLFAIIIKNSENDYSLLLQNDKGAIKITKNDVYEIDEIDFERINTKKIICLGYTENLSYLSLNHEFHSQKDYSLYIYEFMASTMDFKEILTRESISRSKLKRKMYHYFDDEEYTVVAYKFDDNEEYHESITDKIEFKKLEMYIENNDHPAILKKYIDCVSNNESKKIRFKQITNKEFKFSAIFHLNQSANVIYSYLKLFVKDVYSNPEINLFAQINKEYILIPKDKSLTIENIYDAKIDKHLFFTLDGSRPKTIKHFDYCIIPKDRYVPETNSIELEFNLTGEDLIESAKSKSTILKANEIENLIMFYKKNGVVRLFDRENELISIPSFRLHMQIMKHQDFFFSILSYIDNDEICYTNAIFAFPRIEADSFQILKGKLAKYVGVTEDKFELVMKKDGSLKKLKNAKSITAMSTVIMKFNNRSSLPNLVDAD